MKIREGFISNSSSSSFIIAYNKEQNKCPHCGRCDVDILKMIKECTDNDGDTEVRVEGKEEVIQYIQENWWDYTDIIKKIKAVNDMEIALIDVSYHDNTINLILQNNKDIKIIYQDS